MRTVALTNASCVPARYADPRRNYRTRNAGEQRLNLARKYLCRQPGWLAGRIPGTSCSRMLPLSFPFLDQGFGSVSSDSPDPCNLDKPLPGTIDCALSTMSPSNSDCLPATATQTLKFRRVNCC